MGLRNLCVLSLRPPRLNFRLKWDESLKSKRTEPGGSILLLKLTKLTNLTNLNL